MTGAFAPIGGRMDLMPDSLDHSWLLASPADAAIGVADRAHDLRQALRQAETVQWQSRGLLPAPADKRAYRAAMALELPPQQAAWHAEYPHLYPLDALVAWLHVLPAWHAGEGEPPAWARAMADATRARSDGKRRTLAASLERAKGLYEPASAAYVPVAASLNQWARVAADATDEALEAAHQPIEPTEPEPLRIGKW